MAGGRPAVKVPEVASPANEDSGAGAAQAFSGVLIRRCSAGTTVTPDRKIGRSPASAMSRSKRGASPVPLRVNVCFTSDSVTTVMSRLLRSL